MRVETFKIFLFCISETEKFCLPQQLQQKLKEFQPVDDFVLINLFLWSVEVHWTKKKQQHCYPSKLYCHRTNSINNLPDDGFKAEKRRNGMRRILPERFPSSGHQLQFSPQKSWNLKSKGKILIFESTVNSFKPAQKKPQCICCLKSRFWKPLSCILYFRGPVAVPAAGIEWLIIKVRPVCLLWLLLSSD